MDKSVKFWDKLAQTYDQQAENGDQYFVSAVETIKKYLSDSNKVLDFGCGTGIITLDISEKAKEIHAIDTSSKMIEAGKQKARERNIENVKFIQTTVFDEGLRKESYDVILVYSILHYLNKSQEAIHRIAELLKPGGLIISETPCLGEKMTFVITLIFLASKIGVLPPMRFFKTNEVDNLLTEGKFEIIETERYFYHSVTEYLIVAQKK